MREDELASILDRLEAEGIILQEARLNPEDTAGLNDGCSWEGGIQYNDVMLWTDPSVEIGTLKCTKLTVRQVGVKP